MKNEELRMKKLLKKTLKLILPIVLGGFILYWVYRDFDFSRVGEVLRHGTNWWWMLFSLLFGVLAQVFRGWRWRQTLEPLDAFPSRLIRLRGSPSLFKPNACPRCMAGGYYGFSPPCPAGFCSCFDAPALACRQWRICTLVPGSAPLLSLCPAGGLYRRTML